MSDAAASEDTVDLTVPLDTRFAATVRLVAASLGADLGFDVDDLDDLRLGVSEVFTLLAEHQPEGRAHISLTPGDGRLTVRMRSDPASGPLHLDVISRNILDTALDGFEENTDGSVTLVKRLRAGSTNT